MNIFNRRKVKNAQAPSSAHRFDLAAALPSESDFRTSLIMPNLSARFSMLREQDDPLSKLGKANDDSVLAPRRRSRLADFGYTTASSRMGGLSDIAEVASIRSSLPRDDGYGLDDDDFDTNSNAAYTGSVLNRPRQGGNVLFGGRQRVFRVAPGRNGVGVRMTCEGDPVITSTGPPSSGEKENRHARQEEEAVKENRRAALAGLEARMPSPSPSPGRITTTGLSAGSAIVPSPSPGLGPAVDSDTASTIGTPIGRRPGRVAPGLSSYMAPELRSQVEIPGTAAVEPVPRPSLSRTASSDLVAPTEALVMHARMRKASQLSVSRTVGSDLSRSESESVSGSAPAMASHDRTFFDARDDQSVYDSSSDYESDGRPESAVLATGMDALPRRSSARLNRNISPAGMSVQAAEMKHLRLTSGASATSSPADSRSGDDRSRLSTGTTTSSSDRGRADPKPWGDRDLTSASGHHSRDDSSATVANKAAFMDELEKRRNVIQTKLRHRNHNGQYTPSVSGRASPAPGLPTGQAVTNAFLRPKPSTERLGLGSRRAMNLFRLASRSRPSSPARMRVTRADRPDQAVGAEPESPGGRSLAPSYARSIAASSVYTEVDDDEPRIASHPAFSANPSTVSLGHGGPVPPMSTVPPMPPMPAEIGGMNMVMPMTTPSHAPLIPLGMASAMPMSSLPSIDSAKRTIHRHDISGPVRLLATSSTVDVRELPMAGIRSGTDGLVSGRRTPSPPIPAINPRRARFGFGVRTVSAEPLGVAGLMADEDSRSGAGGLLRKMGFGRS